MNNIDTTLIDKAIMYATNNHHNVLRKGKKIPYILHPLEAMAIVSTLTDDYEIIAAAALHDLIEDTTVKYEDIKREFGKRIADIVINESDNALEGYATMTWKEKKQKAFEKLKASPIECKMVALGDKLSNIRAIYYDYKAVGNKLWERFNVQDPKLHKWRYIELTKCFVELKDTEAYKEFNRLVKEMFDGI